MFRKELTYSDISFFSRKISTIKSRFSNEIQLTRDIYFGGIDKKLELGFLMSAPMFDNSG